MYLSEYLNLLNDIYTTGLERTISNFRIKFDKTIYDNLYIYLHSNDEFKNFISEDRKLDNVKEIKTCIISKHEENTTMCILNPANIVIEKRKKRSNKNLNIIIKKNGENSELIRDYIKNNSNGFNSFLKKKNTKEKVSLAAYRKYVSYDEESIDIEKTMEYSTEYQKIKVNTCDKYFIKKKTINLTLYITNDKIITKGGNKCSLRTMIPNTITISLIDNSRLMIFNNGVIQIIPSKEKTEKTVEDFILKLMRLYETLIRVVLRFDNNVVSVKKKKLIKKVIKRILENKKYRIYKSIDYKIESINCDFSYKDVDVIPFPIIDNKYFSKIKFYGSKNINIKGINNKHILADRIKVINTIIENYTLTEKRLLSLENHIFEYDIEFIENIVKDSFIVDLDNDIKYDFNDHVVTNFSNNVPKVYIRSWCIVFRIHFLDNCVNDEIFELNNFFSLWLDGFYDVIMKLIILNTIIDKSKYTITLDKKTKKKVYTSIPSLPKYFNYQDQVDKFMEIVIYLLICFYIERYDLDNKYNFMNIKLYYNYKDYFIIFKSKIFTKMLDNKQYFNYLTTFYKKIFKNRKSEKLEVYISYLRDVIRDLGKSKNRCEF